MSSMSFDFGDMMEFRKTLKRVGDLPQKVVNRAAGKGRNVVWRAIRSKAPVDTGLLKSGIVSRGERSKTRGKKIYRIQFDPNLNDEFQKEIINPGEAGGGSSKGYYPASMEYGFLTRSKGGGLSYVPGYHFMLNASEASAPQMKLTVINTVKRELEKEWTK